MSVIQGSKDKKNLNVELNLLPVFDVLSVCICFLLMTVVWIEVRSLETKQAFGSQSALETTKTSSVWMSIDSNNNITVLMKPADGKERKSMIRTKNGMIDFAAVKVAFHSAVSNKFNAAHLLPAKTTKYDQIIKMMDLAKQAGINDIGLSPI